MPFIASLAMTALASSDFVVAIEVESAASKGQQTQGRQKLVLSRGRPAFHRVLGYNSYTQQLNDPDPFADALEAYMESGKAFLEIERDDGWLNTENVAWYFTNFPDFWAIEKPALKFARGRVLDVGCGAGRIALYLQRKGLRVTGIDSSPRIAALASARGVRDVRVASAKERLPFKRGAFETILLFGNNLGIAGNRAGFEKMLQEFARVTNKNARILATTRAPGMFNSTQRAYWKWKLERGGEMGVVRLRLKFGASEKELDWFWIAPSALMEVAWKNGWRVTEIFGDGRAEAGYAVVLEKKESEK